LNTTYAADDVVDFEKHNALQIMTTY